MDLPNLSMPEEYAVLDFDIENRPISYWIPDRPSADITAIAWAWTGDPGSVYCEVQTKDKGTYEHMLEKFVAAYDLADMVTGHYIRKHDLPIINGALLELGASPLGPKMTSDTKLDLLKKADLSVSQQDLAEMLGVPVIKVHMSQNDWREANRLTPEGIKRTIHRCKTDVEMHQLMRDKLIERGWLGPPREWRP